MSKSKFDFVSVAIVSACILALIFLIYKTINMYNQNKANQTDATAQTTIDDGEADLYDKDGGTYEFDDKEEIVQDDKKSGTTANGSSNEKNNTGNSTATNGSNSDASTSAGDKISGDSKSDTDEGSTTSRDDRTTATNYSHSKGSGRYMVLAGSFRQQENAKSHAAKLRGMGYDGAEVSMFNRGAYASVLVNRFSDRSKARSLAKDLKDKGIDAIVITKQ